jgi:hypothetical protein
MLLHLTTKQQSVLFCLVVITQTLALIIIDMCGILPSDNLFVKADTNNNNYLFGCGCEGPETATSSWVCDCTKDGGGGAIEWWTGSSDYMNGTISNLPATITINCLYDKSIVGTLYGYALQHGEECTSNGNVIYCPETSSPAPIVNTLICGS